MIFSQQIHVQNLRGYYKLLNIVHCHGPDRSCLFSRGACWLYLFQILLKVYATRKELGWKLLVKGEETPAITAVKMFYTSVLLSVHREPTNMLFL